MEDQHDGCIPPNMGGLHVHAFLATAKDARNHAWYIPTTARLPTALSTKLYIFNALTSFSTYIGQGYIHVVQGVK